VLVNPLRVKNWVISELEASLLPYFTGKSRTSANIIHQLAQNVRNRNEIALEAMYFIKEEAFRMKESLLRGDFQLLHEVLRFSWDSKSAWPGRSATSTSSGFTIARSKRAPIAPRFPAQAVADL
jgi:D-glycero-alpha-D-manno-heptose-7-phosphate kinase